jgi:heat shock protein 1/8
MYSPVEADLFLPNISQAEDDKQKDRIAAKNGLESYCFNMKTTIEDEKVKDKISEEDRNKITQKCDEAIKWLDANQLAEVKILCFNLEIAEGEVCI